MPATLQIPSGWIDTSTASQFWRAGVVFRIANGFGAPCWLKTNERVAIKPGETGAQAFTRECGSAPTDSECVFCADF